MPLVYLLIFFLFVILFTREVIAPASGAQCDKRWRILAGAINTLSIVVAIGSGLVFHMSMNDVSLFHISQHLPSIGQSAVVFLSASFVAYWWHRLMHKSDFIWRTVHQLHHSPSRIEALTAFYIHPLDSLIASVLNALVGYLVLGADIPAVALSLLYVGVFNLVAHTDAKTPWLLGLVLQRPEMHRLHHERSQHRSNYGLPVWDMLFGTWRNPRSGSVECGFSPDNEYRIKDMLLMRNVGD